MSEVLKVNDCIPAMSNSAIDKVRQLENLVLEMPQTPIHTSHVLHGGMYARTIKIPAMTVLTGALINIPTILVVLGEVKVFIGDTAVDLSGYNILPASAHRKQAFVAKTDTYLTMMFPTNATTIKEAEDEFTSESHLLISRLSHGSNHIVVTGE